MKNIVLTVLLISTLFPVFSQVDTSFIYNTAMPYGTLDLRLAKSPTRYYYLQEDITFSFRERSPGVPSTTFHDMTTWDSSPYKQGHMREKNGVYDQFVMNYRIMFPANYNPAYDPGYPIIMMLHGGGESGNCWGDNCYWSDTGWNPNTNDPPAPSTELELLNNDRNLFHGGQFHMNAVNAAGAKLPNDPSLPSQSFPGFVLFPQNLTGWLIPSKVEDAIKVLRLIMKKYNIDPNRVYIHGLSNGGAGVNQAIKRAPWLFACALTMSAVTDGEIPLHNMLGEVSKVPLWTFQGGQDTNPTPSRTFNFVKKLRDAGGVVRYYKYEPLGHGTWNIAYKEPDFFPWILSQRKYNPHVAYGTPVICNTTGTGVKIGFPKGFFAYQWQKDGAIISGETSAELIASTTGTYRGRFSRIPNPSDEDWERWSDPIEVSEINPAKPSIIASGSTHLRGPGLASVTANNTVTLSSNVDAGLYNWYKNGTLINFPDTDIDDTLKTMTVVSAGIFGNGFYTLVIKDSYCPSPISDSVYLYFNNSAPQNITLDAAAVNFKGVASSSSAFLTWNDVLTQETGYEIWRRKSGQDFKFVGRAEQNAVSFLDQPLEPGTTYEYKFRAINDTGRSNYIPADDLGNNYSLTTQPDILVPRAPQQLRVVHNTVHSVSMRWEPSQDDNLIKEYIVYHHGQETIVDGNTTTVTLDGLQPNTIFPVTVRARDFADHLSPPSNQLMASTYVLSLYYKHSTGAWTDLDDTTLTITWEHPEFTGTVNNFTLTPRTQEDYYNFQFKGYLNVPQTGDFRFQTTSDDGSRVIIDTTIVVDNDGKHGNRTVTSDTITLSGGLHEIEVQYFDNTGNQNLVVKWAGPGIGDGNTFVAIPDAALKSGVFQAPPQPGAPTDLQVTVTGMRSTALTWSSVETGVSFEIFRSTTQSGTYEIAGTTTSTSFDDTDWLLPGTTYWYKVRAISESAASGYSNVVSVQTDADNTPPSVPANLAIVSKTSTIVAFMWDASTDNATSVHYDVYGNGQKLASTDDPGYTASGLEDDTDYSFAVVAIDESNNQSALSEPLFIAGAQKADPVTAIDPSPEDEEFDVYPNPTNGEALKIRYKGRRREEQVTLRFYHATGTETLQESYDAALMAEGISISAGTLPPGVYIAVIRQGNVERRKRIIVGE